MYFTHIIVMFLMQKIEINFLEPKYRFIIRVNNFFNTLHNLLHLLK